LRCWSFRGPGPCFTVPSPKSQDLLFAWAVCVDSLAAATRAGVIGGPTTSPFACLLAGPVIIRNAAAAAGVGLAREAALRLPHAAPVRSDVT
jgi:hypothetical protein